VRRQAAFGDDNKSGGGGAGGSEVGGRGSGSGGRSGSGVLPVGAIGVLQADRDRLRAARQTMYASLKVGGGAAQVDFYKLSSVGP
jgi:hypothetical protein